MKAETKKYPITLQQAWPKERVSALKVAAAQAGKSMKEYLLEAFDEKRSREGGADATP